MIGRLVAMLLQVAAPQTPASAPEFPVQLGVRVSPDTVTVGQRFVVFVKVRAPAGSTIDFPVESDSAAKASAAATQMIGKPAVSVVPDSAGVTATAAYRLAAWDVDLQPLGLADVVVKSSGKVGYVSLKPYRIFVRSVLPADTTKRIPKPARPPIEIKAFDWRPWLAALAALVAAGLLWRLWVWYRRRKNAPLDPLTVAEREFARIEALGLIAKGEGESHAALMSDVMREYLSLRAPGVEPSQTSSELLASASWIHGVAKGLGELLWRTDLIKFAAVRIAADEAEKLGASARAVVSTVESHLVAEEKAADSRKAA